jgi:hypothetical protein
MIITKNIIDSIGKPKKLGKGDFSMNDLKMQFSFIKKRKLLNRYGETTINIEYYFELSGDGKPIRFLTDEEFRAGKPGYVLGKFLIK